MSHGRKKKPKSAIFQAAKKLGHANGILVVRVGTDSWRLQTLWLPDAALTVWIGLVCVGSSTEAAEKLIALWP